MSEAGKLARYRVEGKGDIDYRTMRMSSEEQNQRRRFVRQALTGTMFANRPNDYIDGMRVEIDENTGIMWIEDTKGYLYFKPAGKASKRDVAFQKERAKIPVEYINKTLKNFDWSFYGNIEKARDAVAKFIENYEDFNAKGMGLYIYSTAKGSGKTMLACCILNEISKRYIGSVKFVTALDLLEMTKKGFNYDNPDVEALYICKTLVIDDIGTQMNKEWVNTVFYRLINERYNSGKPTIYTSNVEIDNLKIDDRIIDRIEGKSFLIHLPEVPVRRIKLNQEKEAIINRGK